jgi:hypothetical protein
MRILIACTAIVLGVSIGGHLPTARADDGDPDPALVGGMYDAGVPPAQIPEDLLRNNPRLNGPTFPYKVFRDLQNR